MDKTSYVQMNTEGCIFPLRRYLSHRNGTSVSNLETSITCTTEMQFIFYNTCHQESQEFASSKVHIFISPPSGFCLFVFFKVLMKGARL